MLKQLNQMDKEVEDL